MQRKRLMISDCESFDNTLIHTDIRCERVDWFDNYVALCMTTPIQVLPSHLQGATRSNSTMRPFWEQVVRTLVGKGLANETSENFIAT